jgi:hypothetical protein
LPQSGGGPIGRGLEPRTMTTFDKREEAFEKRFALDEEEKFKAIARRNKLFGLWVAEQLGKSGDDALVYAKELVATAIDGGEAAVVRKITGDLATRSISVDEAALRAKFDELAVVAAAQVKAGT